MSATLRLTRRHPVELMRTPFEVQSDERIGVINKTRDTLEIPVEPGHHTVRIRSGRYSSRERSFDVAEGELVNFRTHGPLIWPLYVAAMITPDRGISLKHE
jgi:hypothetical protein